MHLKKIDLKIYFYYRLMSNISFTIYKLKNYNVSKNEDGSFNCDSYTGSIDKILKRLEKDKSYNLRIDPSETSILYGDLDHVPSEDFLANSFNSYVMFLIFLMIKFLILYQQSQMSFHIIGLFHLFKHHQRYSRIS